MKKKISMILAMVLIVAFTLTGCAQADAVDGTAVVATLDDSVEMQLGELNLLLRYQQAASEALYSQFGAGGNIYFQDMGNGQLYGEMIRDSLVEQFEEMYILEAEAEAYGVVLTEEEKTAIVDAAKQFIADNSSKTKEILGVNQEMAERVLTLTTIQEKMYAVMTADVDTVVSEEDAAQAGIAYLFRSIQSGEMDEEGNYLNMDEAGIAEVRAELEAVRDAALESGDFKAAAEEKDWYVTEMTYGKLSTSPSEAIRAAADELKEGEFADLIETETGFYLVQKTSEFDAEATELEKENILQDRKDAMFEEKFAELAEDHSFVVDEELVKTVTFNRVFDVIAE